LAHIFNCADVKDVEEMETFKSLRKLPLAEAAAIMRQRLGMEASQSFYTSNEEDRRRLWEALRLQKAQYQAKVKKPARAREELPKPNAQDELEDAWEEELEDGWELTFMFGQRDERTEG
jgi:hypothetical protein